MGPAVLRKCPACRKAGFWMETSHAPFCSERCKLVDLGRWFGGEHCISSTLQAEDLDFMQFDGVPEDPESDQAGE